MNNQLIPTQTAFLFFFAICQELNYLTQGALKQQLELPRSPTTQILISATGNENEFGARQLWNTKFHKSLPRLTKFEEQNGKDDKTVPGVTNFRSNKRSVKRKLRKRRKQKTSTTTNTTSHPFPYYFSNNTTRLYDSKHESTINYQNTEVMTKRFQVDGFKDSEKSSEIPKITAASNYEEDFFPVKLRESSDEINSALVNFGSECDRIDHLTCWFVRGIGDTLTLGISIGISKEFKGFFVQWRKIYKQRQKKKAINMIIEADRLPWNMVLGSGDRELRLNPITNSDIDPNRISAKVYYVVQTKNNVDKYHLIKELKFRIDVPPIDMGQVYYGEELNINMENFLTLPEKGNLYFEWSVEKPDGDKESLPSNVKTSSSGRSIVVKELRNGQMKAISCVVFSSNGISVAKRKFSIQKLVSHDDMRRKSISRRGSELQEDSYFSANSPYQKCFQIQYKNINLYEYMKPHSRRKRYRKDSKIIPLIHECMLWKSHQRLHARWVPQKFPFTTTDPRLKTIEELIDLSEDSDGTLNDIIPHEIHFVEPKVRIVKDSVFENSRYVNFRHCLIDLDCGQGAFCIVTRDQNNIKQNKGNIGFCYCRREYFADGISCRKIPLDKHRGKRIKRNILRTEDSEVVPKLFYSQRDVATVYSSMTEFDTEEMLNAMPQETTTKNQVFEEEESYLLSTCQSNKDCSQHAICYKPRNRDHSFCKCLRGYRGNGIFCWEMMDYVSEDLVEEGKTKIGEQI